MRDPDVVATEGGLLQIVQELLIRVDKLERANRLFGGVPRGGTIQTFDEDGNPLVYIGADAGAAGEEGLHVQDDQQDVHLQVVSPGGVVVPVLAYPVAGGTSFPTRPATTTSTSFVDVDFAEIVWIPSESVTCEPSVSVAAGSIGAVRLASFDGSTTLTTSEIQFSNTSSQQKIFNWMHGRPLTSSAIFFVQMRLVSGAGPVSMHGNITGMQFCGQSVRGATATGI